VKTLEEAGKAPEGGGSEYTGWYGRRTAAADGIERVQQGASDKCGMKVGNVLESQESVKGDESALDGAGRQEWCTWVLESTALVREGEWLDA